MEKRAEMRMAAASNYWKRRWGEPVPSMTPQFAEQVIGRWRNNAQRGIVAIPMENHNHTGQHTARSTQRTTIGGITYELKPGESFLGSK